MGLDVDAWSQQQQKLIKLHSSFNSYLSDNNLHDSNNLLQSEKNSHLF